MRSLTHLTNQELINHLQMADDLTDTEHELLDRLIRMQAEIDRMEYEHS